jgi:hypothetical protein
MLLLTVRVLVCLIVPVLQALSVSTNQGHKHIALCIGGQTGRLHLHELRKWFDHDESSSITIFFNLQNDTRYSFKRNQVNKHASQNYTHSNFSELSHVINQAFVDYPFVEVAKITMHSFVDEAQLKERLIRQPKLDRIRGMHVVQSPV